MGYRSSKERKRRLKKLYDKAKTHYAAGVYYDSAKNRYVKNEWNSSTKKNLKKLSNRRVRKHKMLLDYGSYRKIFDLWWELF